MTKEEKFSAILKFKEEIAEAWAYAPVGWDTWVEVDGEGQVTTSHQATPTSPHPDNENYIMSLSYIYEVADECDDGDGYCHPDNLWEDIENKAERALLSEDD
jgi:hypothetical protein